MQDFLDFLNRNSGALSVVFTLFVALATAAYALLTWRLVSETRKMRQAQTEPKVSVTIAPEERWINFVDLLTQNIGLGAAHNIKFNVEPDFEYAKGEFLSGVNLIKNGLGYLAPSQRIQFFLTSMIDSNVRKDQPFRITVSYQNDIGMEYKNAYVIDFSHLLGLAQLGEPPLHVIAKRVKEIQSHISRLATGQDRMKVIVYTKEDVDKENEETLQRYSARVSEKDPDQGISDQTSAADSGRSGTSS